MKMRNEGEEMIKREGEMEIGDRREKKEIQMEDKENKREK